VGGVIEAMAQPYPSSDLIEQFRDDCDSRGLSPESTRRYISSLRIYALYLAEKDEDILIVDKNVIKGFLDYLRKEREIGQKTVENYFCALSSFYDFLEYEDYVDKNPINSVRKRYISRYKDNDDGQVSLAV
jgi:integrase/recombinase XerD